MFTKKKQVKFDTRSPLEIYKDLKKDDKIATFHPSFYIDKNLDFLSLSGIRIQKQFIAMKVDIFQLTYAIDMDLIIQMQIGIKKKLNIY